MRGAINEHLAHGTSEIGMVSPDPRKRIPNTRERRWMENSDEEHLADRSQAAVSAPASEFRQSFLEAKRPSPDL
jgi:hypothetical protein